MADPDQAWAEYHARKRGERLAEAAALWAAMAADGVDGSTVLAVDFICFGGPGANVQGLRAQLAENYVVQLTPAKEPGYTTVSGTTRPHGITLEGQQHEAWVEFMFDVARSHGCMFSEWSFEVPALGKTFRSADFE